MCVCVCVCVWCVCVCVCVCVFVWCVCVSVCVVQSISLRLCYLPFKGIFFLERNTGDVYSSGEAVVVCDMPEPRKFPSLDSYHNRFLWTNKEIDFAPHPVVGLVLQVGKCGDVSSCTWFRNPDSFFSESASRIPVSHTGGWR